jgi:hypothetical protein
MRVEFQLCQPQNATHFLHHEKYLFKLKQNGTELNCLNAALMRLDDFDQAGRGNGRVTTLNELADVSFHFGNMFFFCCHLEAGHTNFYIRDLHDAPTGRP